MRWLFLLLLMLNGFYYIWHQQEAPLRAKEVLPLSLHRAPQQDIRLLSESDPAHLPRDVDSNCLYLGGFSRPEDARAVEQRLNSLDIQSQFQALQPAAGTGYWLRISPESRRLVESGVINQLAQDFPQLKNKIMSCEGIATAE
ncbi:SPOR domain-containing protein [Pseudomonas alliivorans]|uniref:SPOR domain-containing protein n=1 Tax=Pseudomonas viridiflava TaxID=33069 RepID=UPI000C06F0F5|nr:SPOR domain-containing protein [Pseudomonas viridiflava]MEE4375448.1 SPOR domain-containing protein [Pseudomonas alliivorans]MEE4575534.1 SPOR domain-containing protein [Pseudomonas alliivorans]MEE4621235.1 SPOR domain-containing protein [Pseudomonas alliivorans]MEE4626331.1 SPOR domain-containing protein [Pseudomonas alliivorans]MEE4692935.1 SPOR domain-containing protein [Pseudomonas alliivorans]